MLLQFAEPPVDIQMQHYVFLVDDELFARCLAGILSLLNPDTVIFAGGVSRCFPLIASSFFAELERRTPRFSLPLTRVVLSDFGDLAGAMGAGLRWRQARKTRMKITAARSRR